MQTTFMLLPDGKIEEQYTAKDYESPSKDAVCTCYRVWSDINKLYKYRRFVRLTAANVRMLNAQFVAAGLKMPFIVITNCRVELS